jgi:endoglucanase
LDVKGGWYDAGDYGKYVVNGGIALWTLFNLYERARYFGTKLDDFSDGKLNIPESGNEAPDLSTKPVGRWTSF